MIIKCPACEQKNRVDATKLADQPKCGACKTVIDYYVYPVNVAAKEFDAVIEHETGPVVVDFWSPTCGPCLMAAPELDKYAAEHPDTLVLKINATENVSLLQRFGISGVPTFQVYKNGDLKKTEVGFLDARQMGEKFAV